MIVIFITRVFNLTKLARMVDIIKGFGLGCSTLSIHQAYHFVHLVLSDGLTKIIRVNLPFRLMDLFILNLLYYVILQILILMFFQSILYFLSFPIYWSICFALFYFFFSICVDEGSDQSYRGTENHPIWRQ